jgi:hypothetical protein
MDKDTLLAVVDLSRTRLLATLDTIEKSGQDLAKVLAWRPGPGRAHIAWQAMHCAATHDRYLNATLLKRPMADDSLVASFAGGSVPSDSNVPDLPTIRAKLAATLEPFRKYLMEQSAASLENSMPGPGGKPRTLAETCMILAWHEAHHQGQIHLTWNLYRAAHGLT